MLRFIASMASGGGLGIVCAIVTVLVLVAGPWAGDTALFFWLVSYERYIINSRHLFEGRRAALRASQTASRNCKSTSALQITAARASAAHPLVTHV